VRRLIEAMDAIPSTRNCSRRDEPRRGVAAHGRATCCGSRLTPEALALHRMVGSRRRVVVTGRAPRGGIARASGGGGPGVERIGATISKAAIANGEIRPIEPALRPPEQFIHMVVTGPAGGGLSDWERR